MKTEITTQINIVIKGWYEKPPFNNRFTIDWPFSEFPSIGHYIDIRTFLLEPDDLISETYRVDTVQWNADGPYVILVPLK